MTKTTARLPQHNQPGATFEPRKGSPNEPTLIRYRGSQYRNPNRISPIRRIRPIDYSMQPTINTVFPPAPFQHFSQSKTCDDSSSGFSHVGSIGCRMVCYTDRLCSASIEFLTYAISVRSRIDSAGNRDQSWRPGDRLPLRSLRVDGSA